VSSNVVDGMDVGSNKKEKEKIVTSLNKFGMDFV
jgi:hypothetical protein